MKIGERVCRKDAPEILGEALMLADNPNDSPTQKEDL
jgi:hypothetical protein